MREKIFSFDLIGNNVHLREN